MVPRLAIKELVWIIKRTVSGWANNAKTKSNPQQRNDIKQQG